MYLSLQVSRNFSIWVGVIRSNWYKTRGWKDRNQVRGQAAGSEPTGAPEPIGEAECYLCCAVVVDAVFISGLLDLLRNALDEIFYFLKDYTANISHIFLGDLDGSLFYKLR